MKLEKHRCVREVVRLLRDELEDEEVLRGSDGELDPEHGDVTPSSQGIDLEGRDREQQVDDDRFG